VEQRVLDHAVVAAVAVLVREGAQARARLHRVQLGPGAAHLDPVDAPAPRVVLHQPRRGRLGLLRQPAQLAGRGLTHPVELRLDLREDLRR
jgi:hypothetical protein